MANDPSPPSADAVPETVWHTLESEEACRQLGCDVRGGLGTGEIEDRLRVHGVNVLVRTAGRGPWRILAEQLRGSLIVLLAVAAAVSVVLGETRDAIAILTIVALNVVLGFVQDYRAERAMAALQRLSEPLARVRREGVERRVETRQIVPGDILLLEAGDRVAADGRLLEAFDFHVEEAALTGESQAVIKDVAALPAADLPLGDRTCMVYQGTMVTHGRASAVVVATGMKTELGKIARLLQTVRRELTPLQRRLSRLGRDLSLAAIVLVLAVVALSTLYGSDLRLALMVGLALAVAAVPEGLPAVATVALALGAKRMLDRNALIRKLPAVETLGSVTVICTDKTGTLTQNRMHVAALEPADGPLAPDGAGELPGRPAAAWLLTAAALSNDAALRSSDARPGTADADPAIDGDPTEVALTRAALELGLDKRVLERALPRIAEVPFDSHRKRMSTVHRLGSGDELPETLRAALGNLPDASGEGAVLLAKGAVESMLEISTEVLGREGLEKLDDPARERIRSVEESLADRGMRVLGFACRRVEAPAPSGDPHDLEKELVFLGLVGIDDPLRPQVEASVRQCRQAGVRTVMITGDHPRTAIAVARQAGIASDGHVIDGHELSALSTEELDRRVEELEIYARVSPEDKLRIVESWERHGEIVAMTGDGVNDAPSLRRADIGVAMGVIGTDVAREAADMVLLDDDFSTIVAAVRQGRRVYDNIRRFLVYTLASNTGEILTMALAPLLGMPLALLPLQILWINLVTDGLPGLALGIERVERGVMRRPPVAPDARILGSRGVVAILWIGALMGIVALGAGHLISYGAAAGEAHWRTLVFTVLTLSQLGNALALRSFQDGFRRRPLSSSPVLAVTVAATFGLQLAVIYLPFFQGIFDTVALSLPELAACVASSTLVLTAVEIRKWVARRRESGSSAWI